MLQALIASLIALALGFGLLRLSDLILKNIEDSEREWCEHMLAQRAENKAEDTFSVANFSGKDHKLLILFLGLFLVVGFVVAYRITDLPHMVAAIGFVSVCLALGWADIRAKLLPDALTLPLIWSGMLLQLYPATQTVGIESSVLGAAVGYLLFWLIAKAYYVVRKRDGLGHGDMKLLAASGAWLGLHVLPGIILASSVMALAWHGFLMFRKKSSMTTQLAFGPWIVASIVFYVVLFLPA